MKRFFKLYWHYLAYLLFVACLAVLCQITTGDCKLVLAGVILGSTIGDISKQEDIRKELEDE